MAPGFIAIGSGPAGLTAAEAFRQRHQKIPVRLLSSDPALPYAKPPLSKTYLCGRDPKLDLHTPGWFIRHAIQLDRGITVEHIDPANREVVTAAGRRYRYWHLVLACGARPVPLAVPGGEAALSLRSFADAVVLRMAAKNSESAVVVGGGLIGCEAATCLAARGVATTLVAPEPVPVQRRFGVEVGERVAKMLSDIGVRFIGSTSVAAVDEREVTLDSGAAMEAELVVSATGVRPDSRLADGGGPRHRRTAASSSTSTCTPRRPTCTPRAMSRSHTTSRPDGRYRPSIGATPSNRGEWPARPRRDTPAAWDDSARILLRHRAIGVEVPRLGHAL